MDELVSHHCVSFYYADVLFYFRAVSFRDPACAATPAQNSCPVVESGISRCVAPANVDADFSNHRAFNCRLAVRVDCRPPRVRSRPGNGQAGADSRHAPAHSDSSRRVAAADSKRAHWLADSAVHPWRLWDFLSGRRKLDLWAFRERGNTRAKTLR